MTDWFIDMTSLLHPGRWSAGADSEQHEQRAKPHRSGKQQYGPHSKSRTCHTCRKIGKKTDQDTHNPDSDSDRPFNSTHIAFHGSTSFVKRFDTRKDSLQTCSLSS
jgi:hypothetical protein